MRKINILSVRKVEIRAFWDIVYEWEDVLSEKLNGNIINIYKSIGNYEIYKNIGKFKRPSLSGLINHLLNKNRIINPTDYNLYFEMWPKKPIIIFKLKFNRNSNNKKNNIPIFIDFYLKDSDLPDFYESYSKSPFILVTSYNAYEYLIKKKSPLKIYHYPLSISDKYALSNKFYKKEYDLILAGRTNPFLQKCLDIYCKKNTDLIYVYRKNIGNKFVYVNNKGNIISNGENREDYINLIRKSKIAFYSTNGIDTEIDRHLQDQVTPRLFELMCAQCSIIARYPKNDDTDFYKLNEVIPSVNNYEEFELLMDTYRDNESFPLETYSEFLSRHYTSVRAELLLNIIRDYEK